MVRSSSKKRMSAAETWPMKMTEESMKNIKGVNIFNVFINSITNNFKNADRVTKNDLIFLINFYGPGTIVFNGEIVELGDDKDEVSENFSNRGAQLGICDENYFKNFLEVYYNVLHYNYKKIKNFCDGRKKDCHIHISQKPELELEENSQDFRDFTNPTTGFHPNGLWYSCETSWLDFVYKKLDGLENTLRDYMESVQLAKSDFEARANIPESSKDSYVSKAFMIDYRWFPTYVYSLDLRKLNIRKIDDCKELRQFSKKTRVGGFFNTNYNISLQKVVRNYDGIQICPYLGLKCNSFFRSIYGDLVDGDTIRDIEKNPVVSEDDDYQMLVAWANKEGKKIAKKDREVMWSLHWDAATGVVLKNFGKVGVKRII